MGALSKPINRHIIMHAIAAWGHNKPLITFAILIAEARPNVILTILTNASMHAKMHAELKNLPEERLDPISHRVHIINVGGETGSLPGLEMDQVASSLITLYKQSGVVTCLTSGNTVGGPDLPPPSVAIIDPFAPYAIAAIRSVASPLAVPILLWFTSTAGTATHFVGPEELGGGPDFVDLIDKETKLSGRPFKDVAPKLIFPVKGEVIQLPGYPALYDYELTPQETNMPGHEEVIYAMRKAAYQVEGTITASTSVLEKDAVQAIRSHFQKLGQEWINIAPLSVIPGVQVSTKKDEAIDSFLGRMEQQFGGRSVLYISFGSVWWPPKVDTLWALLDSLIAERVPFIMASPSPFAQVPDDIKQRARESGIGMIVNWAPQEHILTHSATGWFLTHGGWNSTQEALVHKVPLIFWPIGADQPLISALLTLTHEAAFELVEVRTGEHGTKKPYRCNSDGMSPKFTLQSAKEEFHRVLKSIRGEEGQRVRSNFLQLAEQIEKTWDDGGEAREQLEFFLGRFVD
ncbi:hypothetical protein VNI00_014428 [Paramarasmius palmivorus]|uniref:UDP-Glycosyltransferase/glycogen phosphorylase n=1 Tax=Paramarasmius palmivorus TaxID=297713 RepID=A0AAW0BTK7_9AGAR